MYGYRLPESDVNLIYYTLNFHYLNPTPYTYPSVCVRPDFMTIVGQVDQMAVLKAFFMDLTKKMATVCGEPFSVKSKIGYAVAELNQWRESLGKPNISTKPSLPKGLVSIESPFLAATATNKTSPTDMFSTQCSADISLATQTQRDTAQTNRRFDLTGTSSTSQGRPLTTRHISGQTASFTKSQGRPIFDQCNSNRVASFTPSQSHPIMDQRNSNRVASFTPSQSHPIMDQRNSNHVASFTPSQDRPIFDQRNSNPVASFTPSQRRPIIDQCNSNHVASFTPSQGRPIMDQRNSNHVANFTPSQGCSIIDQHNTYRAANFTPSQGHPLTNTNMSQNTRFTAPLQHSSYNNQSNCKHATSVALSPQISKQGHHPTLADSPPTYIPFAVSRATSVQGESQPSVPPSNTKYKPVFLPRTNKPLVPQKITIQRSGQGNKPPTPLPKHKSFNPVKVENPMAKMRSDNSRGTTGLQREDGTKPLQVVQTSQQATRVPTFGTKTKVHSQTTMSLLSRSNALPMKLTTLGMHGTTSHGKRAADSQEMPSSGGLSNKKPRSKPRVKVDVNVEDLARDGSLEKLNSATLIAWLREIGVPCKTKDKKGDLVGKVLSHLNIKK